MQKGKIFVSRNSTHVVLIDMQTCQKLIIEDKAMMAKSDDELKSIYRNFGALSQNARV